MIVVQRVEQAHGRHPPEVFVGGLHLRRHVGQHPGGALAKRPGAEPPEESDRPGADSLFGVQDHLWHLHAGDRRRTRRRTAKQQRAIWGLDTVRMVCVGDDGGQRGRGVFMTHPIDDTLSSQDGTGACGVLLLVFKRIAGHPLVEGSEDLGMNFGLSSMEHTGENLFVFTVVQR